MELAGRKGKCEKRRKDVEVFYHFIELVIKLDKKTEAETSVFVFLICSFPTAQILKLKTRSEHYLITVKIVDTCFSTQREKLC